VLPPCANTGYVRSNQLVVYTVVSGNKQTGRGPLRKPIAKTKVNDHRISLSPAFPTRYVRLVVAMQASGRVQVPGSHTIVSAHRRYDQ